ncbi:S1C family serine protease [Homoserinibacter sp. GY 40078]|uniref:S1C family serine protease n=1 Tax=Homoserinibacter sp. GY 40078 TaxID=2603275 RepID=UPI002103E3B9|nr:trypsin-like peptidase domain-containing protein [Homoserinibacter sp. GY 40078]
MSETPSSETPTPEDGAPAAPQPTAEFPPPAPIVAPADQPAPVAQPVAEPVAPAAESAPAPQHAPAVQSAFVPPSTQHAQPTEPLPPAGLVPPSFAAAPPAAPPASPSAATGQPESRPRSIMVPVIAAAVVAALLGGGAGAGVAAWAITSQDDTTTASSAGSNQTITVNNPDSVDVVTAVAAKAAPSVVTISVTTSSAGGTGSGVILSEDGYVLTNTHVVTLDGESADGTIEVTTSDGHIYSAEVVGLDPIVDLAVLKLDGASGLTPIEWGDSDSLDVGDQVIAIGAPLGLSNTVTDGIVSALDRSIQIASSAVPDDTTGDSDSTPDDNQNGGQGPFDFWNFDDSQGQSGSSSTSSTISLPVIQTDAAINPGNSGGALVDSEGRLVGINVAIASTGSSSSSQSGSIGVGFSIPASLAQRVAEEIIADGEATHGLLGASVTTATSSESDVVGSVIQEVTSGGAAAAAGLEAGDVVTSFNGHPITSSTDLTAQVRALAAGSQAELVYLRDGESHTVTVTLGQL